MQPVPRLRDELLDMSPNVLWGDLSDDFWINYQKGRPSVPTSFFNRIFDYHASHGGKFNLVNDIGAGNGQFSLDLAKRFKVVALTEPAENSLDSAKGRLLGRKDYAVNSETLPASAASPEFRFYHAKAEDADVQAPSTVDMVFACNTLHWTSIKDALSSIEKQLVSGGTFCAALFGLRRFLDPAVQSVWDDIFEAGLQAMMAHERAAAVDMASVNELQESGYDAISLDEGAFRPGAQRVKINFRGDKQAFRMTPRSRESIPYVSRVGVQDELLEEETTEDWCFEADLQDLQAAINTYPFRLEAQAVEPLWLKMGEVLRDGRCQGYWPVSIILATKR